MTTQNPYKGLFPYKAEDERNFFGRDKEVHDLIEMIKNNQLVILYGDSGTGKTSLINAKLFPELKRQYYFPIYIRLNYTIEVEPLEQIRQTIYSQLKSWDEHVPIFETGMTLIEFAARTNVFNGLVKPIVFFDQFEELFTLAPKYTKASAIEELMSELADLIEVRISSKNRQKKNSSFENNIVQDRERKTDTDNILRFTVVFCLRQDYIAQLDDFKYKIPSIISTKYRLKKFSTWQALEAIIGPAEYFKKQYLKEIKENNFQVFTEDSAALVITKLGTRTIVTEETDLNVFTSGNISSEIISSTRFSHLANDLEIDVTMLSLYCFQLFKEAAVLRNALPSILADQVSKSSPEELVKNYYEDGLKNFGKAKRAIENYLITNDGRRLLTSLSTFVKESKLEESQITKLIDQTALLRIYGKGHTRDIEIVHDQISKRALISKKTREANRIKRNAVFVFFAGFTIILMGVIVTNMYVRNQERQVNIQYLQARVDTLTNQNEIFMNARQNFITQTEEAEKNYRELVTNSNVLISDNSLINRQVAFIKDQLKKEMNRNNELTSKLNAFADNNTKLSSSLSVLQSKYDVTTDSVKMFVTTLNKKNDEINKSRKKIVDFQQQLNYVKKASTDSMYLLARKVDQQNNELTKAIERIKNLEGDNAQAIAENTQLRRNLDVLEKIAKTPSSENANYSKLTEEEKAILLFNAVDQIFIVKGKVSLASISNGLIRILQNIRTAYPNKERLDAKIKEIRRYSPNW